MFLPVAFSGIQSLTAHAADNEMKKQITVFYNRVAGVFGFEVSKWNIKIIYLENLLNAGNNPPAPQARGGLKVDIQIFSYRLAKPSKPVFFPKVEKSDANWRFSGQKKTVIAQA